MCHSSLDKRMARKRVRHRAKHVQRVSKRRRRPKKRQGKRRPRGKGRQVFKPKLIDAMNKLKNMGASRRVREIVAAPDKLIRDMSSALQKAKRHKVALPKVLAKQVKKHAVSLRKLSNPRLSIKKKRQLIKQKGGGLLGTIAGLLPIVGPLISGARFLHSLKLI